MNRSWLVMLAACDAGSASPYGTKPHIMGRAGVLDVHDTLAIARDKFPQVADNGVGQFHDGTTDYRVFYSEAGRIESVIVYQTGKLAELVGGWGRGTPCQMAGGAPAHCYLDAAAGTIHVASEGMRPDQFIVASSPYLPLDKIWDDGHDIRVFGLDLLGRPLADDVAALEALGHESRRQDETMFSVGELMSDAGKVQWSLTPDAKGRVTKISVQIGPYEIPSNVAAIDARFVEKWGTPTEGRERHFPVDTHTIVEFHDKDIWITE